jgi:hypothetical protein
VLSPRVAFLDQQRTILTVGNSHLKQRIAALAQDKIFKDGQYSSGNSVINTIPSYQGFRIQESPLMRNNECSLLVCSSSRGAQGGNRAAEAGVPAAEPQDVVRRGLRPARPRRAASCAPREGAHELIESLVSFDPVQSAISSALSCIDQGGNMASIVHETVGAFLISSSYYSLTCVSFFARMSISVLVRCCWEILKGKLKCTSSCKFSCSTAFCVCRLFQFSFGVIQFFLRKPIERSCKNHYTFVS